MASNLKSSPEHSSASSAHEKGSEQLHENAGNYVNGLESQAPFTKEEEAALVKKLDWRLMPLMAMTMALQCIDKGIMGAGNVVGLSTDLGLYRTLTNAAGETYTDSGRYSDVISFFYVGMIIGAYPLAAIAQRYPIAKVTAIYTMLWAMVLFMLPLCKNYSGVMAQRFFLGLFEAGIPPAYQVISGMWYRKAEQGQRVPIWYSFGFLGLSLGYIINSGIIRVQTGIAPWQFLFLFWSTITFLWAFIPLIYFPDSIETAKFLNERERFIATERLRDNHDSIKEKHIKKEHLVATFSDYKVWLLFVIIFFTLLPNYVGSVFLPTIVRGLGFTPYNALLLSAPGPAVCWVLGLGSGYIAQHVKNSRSIVSGVNLLVCLSGVAVLWQVPRSNTAASLYACYANFGFASAYVVLLSLVPSNCGSSTKKALASGLMLIAYSASNIAAPKLFKRDEGPTYTSAFKINTACIAACIGVLALYYFALRRENAKRDAMGAESHQAGDFSDKDDRQNMSFRYVY